MTLTASGDAPPIYGVIFASTSPAFEIDNLAFADAAVPEPASWAMMLLGFAAIGCARRRRRSAAPVAVA